MPELYEWGEELETLVTEEEFLTVKALVLRVIKNCADFVKAKAEELSLTPQNVAQLEAAARCPEEGGGGGSQG